MRMDPKLHEHGKFSFVVKGTMTRGNSVLKDVKVKDGPLLISQISVGEH